MRFQVLFEGIVTYIEVQRVNNPIVLQSSAFKVASNRKKLIHNIIQRTQVEENFIASAHVEKCSCQTNKYNWIVLD